MEVLCHDNTSMLTIDQFYSSSSVCLDFIVSVSLVSIKQSHKPSLTHMHGFGCANGQKEKN